MEIIAQSERGKWPEPRQVTVIADCSLSVLKGIQAEGTC